MYEIKELTPRCLFMESPAKIGIIRLSESEVCLIDSGSDKEAGRKVRQQLDANKWKLKAIFNTHSNADHIGGNAYLQKQTGCEIYAPGIECCFTRHPILEPSFLYGGYPFSELRHKFILAQESNVRPLTADVLPEGMTAIPLPGHFFDMTGFAVEDGGKKVIYPADALSSLQTLEKYRIGFIYDVGRYLDTLETLKNMEADMFVPSHAEATDNIAPLAQANIDNVLENGETILEICREPASFEAVLKKIFDRYTLSMNAQQYVLVGSTVRSYLSWLRETGRMEILFDSNMMLWKEKK